MARLAALLLAMFACWTGLSLPVRATVKSYDRLPLDRKMALEESERRLVIYDHALTALDYALQHKKIRRQDYDYDERDLRAYILAEARFQNDILKNESGFVEASREVMENIAKYAIEIPVCILLIAARCASGSSFSP